jgi:hypothetical protein
MDLTVVLVKVGKEAADRRADVDKGQQPVQLCLLQNRVRLCCGRIQADGAEGAPKNADEQAAVHLQREEQEP